jgi:hypothetical protein
METLESLLVSNILSDGKDRLECDMPSARSHRRTAKIRATSRLDRRAARAYNHAQIIARPARRWKRPRAWSKPVKEA